MANEQSPMLDPLSTLFSLKRVDENGNVLDPFANGNGNGAGTWRPPMAMPGNGAPPPTNAPTPPPTGKVPSPSDDLPQVPDYSKSPLASKLQRVQGLEQQFSNIKPVDYTQRPKWYDWLLGGAASAVPFVGRQLGPAIINRRVLGQERQHQTQAEPVLAQLQQERQDLPAYAAGAGVPYQEFQAKLSLAKEKREQALAQSRGAQFEARAQALEGKFIAGTELQDPNSPTGWTAQTVEGDRKPFTPSSTFKAGPREPKNSAEAKAAASAETDPKEKKRLLDLANELHQDEMSRIYAEHPDREDKKATKGQFNQANVRKAGALARAEREYTKTVKALDPSDKEGLASAQQTLEDAKQNAQDAYEQEVMSLGGEAQHYEYGQPAPTAPPATTPAKPNGQAAPPKAQQRVATPKDVADYAAMKKIDIEAAKRAFRQKGWTVR